MQHNFSSWITTYILFRSAEHPDCILCHSRKHSHTCSIRASDVLLLLLLLLLLFVLLLSGKGVMKSDGKPRFHKDGKVWKGGQCSTVQYSAMLCCCCVYGGLVCKVMCAACLYTGVVFACCLAAFSGWLATSGCGLPRCSTCATAAAAAAGVSCFLIAAHLPLYGHLHLC